MPVMGADSSDSRTIRWLRSLEVWWWNHRCHVSEQVGCEWTLSVVIRKSRTRTGGVFVGVGVMVGSTVGEGSGDGMTVLDGTGGVSVAFITNDICPSNFPQDDSNITNNPSTNPILCFDIHNCYKLCSLRIIPTSQKKVLLHN